MKTDFYTKTVLTVIALCLTIIVIRQIGIIPDAKAIETNLNSGNLNYGLVPLNVDGSIDVNIKSNSSTIDVNIESCESWALQWAFGKYPVPVSIED